MSLVDRITTYLRKHGGYVNGGVIEELAQKAGYKASNASRRLRELAEEGVVEADYRKGANGVETVWYRITSKDVEVVKYVIDEETRTVKKVITKELVS